VDEVPCLSPVALGRDRIARTDLSEEHGDHVGVAVHLRPWPVDVEAPQDDRLEAVPVMIPPGVVIDDEAFDAVRRPRTERVCLAHQHSLA
jgi:hypothetical protein